MRIAEKQAAGAGGRVAEPDAVDADAPCTAETAECTCPDFCERDHDNE